MGPWTKDPLIGIGAVEDDDVGAGFCCGFKKIADDGLVGVEANSGILQVDDDGIEFAQRFQRWAAVAVFRAIQADDGQAGCGIGGVGNAGLVVCAAQCRVRG